MMHIDFNRCYERNRLNFFVTTFVKCIDMVYFLVQLDEMSDSVHAFQANFISHNTPCIAITT